MKSTLEKYKNIIVPIVVRYLPNIKIILYGSRARGDDKEGSDIDVALDAGDTIDTHVMSKIEGDLEDSRLPICYDVVDFRAVSEAMQKSIIKDGVVWKK